MLQQYSKANQQELALTQHRFSSDLCKSLKEAATKIQTSFHEIQALIMAECNDEVQYLPVLKRHAVELGMFNKFSGAAEALLQSVKPKVVRGTKRKAAEAVPAA